MFTDARTPVIVEAVRTPIGKFQGALAPIRPDDLASSAISAIVKGYPEALEQLSDVYLGAANQSGEDNRNVARMALLLAGLPVTIPGVTVNRLCGSGMEAVLQAAKSILVGEGEVYIAGGVESMTRAPFVLTKASAAYGRDNQLFDTALGWRMINPRMDDLYPVETLGITAENVAERYMIRRERQDEWALRSHQRAAAAQEQGHFKREMITVEIPQAKSEPLQWDLDEGVRRDTSLAKLSTLKPVFRSKGSVTAGNSSPLSDGASALLLLSLDKARQLGLTPLARIVSWGHAGVHPSVMGIGPIPASRQALQRAGLHVRDLDAIELNEAFASQTLACIDELGLPPEKVNPNGGAIALGHPLGCSGARIITTLTHHLIRTQGRWGLASMCVGLGQGIACVIERL